MMLHWYTPEDAENENDRAALIAMALVMWANCSLQEPPSHFGNTMIIICKKLGIAPVPSEIDRLAKEWQAEHEQPDS